MVSFLLFDTWIVDASITTRVVCLLWWASDRGWLVCSALNVSSVSFVCSGLVDVVGPIAGVIVLVVGFVLCLVCDVRASLHHGCAAVFGSAGGGLVLLCGVGCLCGQAGQGAWWMPWHREPMKDVGACDKPWGVGNRALIRGCPNGETQHESCRVTCT